MSSIPSSQPSHLATTAQTGTLGIPHLEKYWAQGIAARSQASTAAKSAKSIVADNVLLAGLRLGVRETLDFLIAQQPSLAEFEDWVLSKNAGRIDPAHITRLNAALRGEVASPLPSILPEPVLSDADLAFWHEHGYVVVKDAISSEQCTAAASAIFDYAGMDIHQPDSWYAPSVWLLLAQHPALWAARTSPRIHTAFAQLWQRRDLWMNVDVCGVNPPVRPGYQFRGAPLHWDMTLTPPVRFGTQAILYLTDTAADQGAFSCVPGFHHRLESWLQEVPPGRAPRDHALEHLRATPIAGRAGDLIIWHHALPHGATPNLATLPRIVQYLNMFPSQYELNADWS